MHCLNKQDPAAKEKYFGAIEDKIPVIMWTPVWIEEEFGTSIELGALSLIIYWKCDLSWKYLVGKKSKLLKKLFSSQIHTFTRKANS